MAATQVVYKLSPRALNLLKAGKAEWTPGGIRDVSSKKIIELAKPVYSAAMKKQETLQTIAGGLKTVQALSWVNTAMNLANLGVTVAGFYTVLTKMESMQGEIHQFISRYNADKEKEHFDNYKNNLANMGSHLYFLQNRYLLEEYNDSVFILREPDIEKECNEAATFLDGTIQLYQSRGVPAKLACQILFTLSPIYAELVNEYCCQYYCVHGIINRFFEQWKAVLDQINSDSFHSFMKREMVFGIQYVDLPPQKRSDALRVAFHCVQELTDNLSVCSEVIKTVPKGTLIPVEVLRSAKDWDDIKGMIKTEAGESPEEYMRRQINQMEIDENDDVVYVPVQMMQ